MHRGRALESTSETKLVNEHLCPENEMLRLPRIPSFHHAEYNEMIHERYFKMMETRTNDNWTDKVRIVCLCRCVHRSGCQTVQLSLEG